MELHDKKFHLPRMLHDLLGRTTTRVDLISILSCSICLAIVAGLLTIDSEISIFKRLFLILLALDIGGGVVANFTEGTNNYYFESKQRRNIFIAIHIVQPSILSWIFTVNLFNIIFLTTYTLISSFIITSMKQVKMQKTIASLLLVIGIIIISIINFSPQILNLILLIFSIKLILSFPVNWVS